MRYAHTIKDLVELLADYAVSVQLADTNELLFLFPPMEDYNAKYIVKTEVDTHLAERFNDGIYQPQSLAFSHLAKRTISSLLGSPEFWRKTTVADQVGNFARYQNTHGNYGTIKVRKRANQPLTAMFSMEGMAEKLFKDLHSIDL